VPVNVIFMVPPLLPVINRFGDVGGWGLKSKVGLITAVPLTLFPNGVILNV
jgi:hypothetical protein